MNRWLVAFGALFALMAASPVRAQRLPRPSFQPSRRDTTRRDTTAADSIMAARLRLSPPDSIMQALMRRPGYNTTRYEGQRVTFDAQNDIFQILAGTSGRALVQRGDSQTVFADTGIYFDQRTKVATATGNLILHDPSSGQADVIGRGRLQYSLNERSATITNPMFAANVGQVWEIHALKGKSIFGDSAAGKGSTFYGLGGNITSCTDSVPDYHFDVKEIKRTGSNTLVARPAVLYIRDIPVMWLPFMFSDTRPGRHSGLLTPRFGLSDFIRTSPSYRRNIENVGYFLSINDYMDASAWVDWRSSAGGTAIDPGWTKLSGEWRYNWLDRFMSGSLASSYTMQRDGQTNLALTWGHRQRFTRDRNFSADVNYVTSTTLQRQNTYNPYAALATIRSSVTYSDKIGPAQLQLGGTRSQYPGRPQVDETLPTLSINTGTLNVASWLQWTPNFSYTATQSLHLDSPGDFAYNYLTGPNGVLDSVRTKRDQYNTTTRFDTPLTIFGYALGNSFTFNEKLYDYPQRIARTDVNTGQPLPDRIYPNLFETDVDWTPNFTLPALARSLFNITPSVSLENATSGPFWVRSNLSDGQFVHQTKRPSFSISAAPVIYGLLPGFGPFSRLRHTLQPTISYSYAPKAGISTDYLQALGRSKAHEYSGLQQNQLSFGLNQNIEAKVRTPNDTNPDAAQKIKLLSLSFSSIAYDIDRARAAHQSIRGLTTSTFNYSVSSDLLPGFQFSSSYSLFSGDPVSDTARFSPYLESIQASLNLAQGNNPFTVLTRLFGRAVPNDQRPSATPTPDQTSQPGDAYAQQIASQPVAGSGARGTQFIIPPTQGWSAALTFSASQSRPVTGANVIQVDPLLRCRQIATNTSTDPAEQSLVYSTCVAQTQTTTTPTSQAQNETGIVGTTILRNPPMRNLGGNFSFGLTQNWSVTWNTSYDLVKHQFAEHIVTLQRDLHDWRAVFAFTQSPNGNFAFNFFIALKAEPDLKFNYNKATVRSGAF